MHVHTKNAQIIKVGCIINTAHERTQRFFIVEQKHGYVIYTSKRNQTAGKKQQHSRPFTPGEEPNQPDGDGDVGGEVFPHPPSSRATPRRRQHGMLGQVDPTLASRPRAQHVPPPARPRHRPASEPTRASKQRAASAAAPTYHAAGWLLLPSSRGPPAVTRSTRCRRPDPTAVLPASPRRTPTPCSA